MTLARAAPAALARAAPAALVSSRDARTALVDYAIAFSGGAVRRRRPQRRRRRQRRRHVTDDDDGRASVPNPSPVIPPVQYNLFRRVKIIRCSE